VIQDELTQLFVLALAGELEEEALNIPVDVPNHILRLANESLGKQALHIGLHHVVKVVAVLRDGDLPLLGPVLHAQVDVLALGGHLLYDGHLADPLPVLEYLVAGLSLRLGGMHLGGRSCGFWNVLQVFSHLFVSPPNRRVEANNAMQSTDDNRKTAECAASSPEPYLRWN